MITGGEIVSTASQDQTPLEEVRVADRACFQEGPPLELFRRLRSECPLHWSKGISDYPEEDGFWSVTTALNAMPQRMPFACAGSYGVQAPFIWLRAR